MATIVNEKTTNNEHENNMNLNCLVLTPLEIHLMKGDMYRNASISPPFIKISAMELLYPVEYSISFLLLLKPYPHIGLLCHPNMPF